MAHFAGCCAKHQYRYMGLTRIKGILRGWIWAQLVTLVLQWPKESFTLSSSHIDSCSGTFPPLHQLWSLSYLFTRDFSYLMQWKHGFVEPSQVYFDECQYWHQEYFDECSCWHKVGSALATEGTLRSPAFSSNQLWTHCDWGDPTSMDSCPMDAPIQKFISIPLFVASVACT